MPIQDDLKQYLQQKLFPVDTPEEEVALAEAKEAKKYEDIGNILNKAIAGYSSAGGADVDPIQVSGASDEYARQLKSQQDLEALKNRLAEKILTSELKPSIGKISDRPLQVTEGKYKGAFIYNDPAKGRFLLDKGNRIYESDAKTDEEQRAFRSLKQFGREITEGRRELKEGQLSGQILKSQGLTDKQSEKLGNIYKYKKDIDDVEFLLADFERKGKDLPVGFWKDWREGKKPIVPFGLAGEVDKDYAKLKAVTGKNLVEFMKEISGVAIAESEAKRLMGLLPHVGNDPVTFRTNYAEWKADLKDKIASFMEANADRKNLMLHAERLQDMGLFEPTQNFYDLQNNLLQKSDLRGKQKKALRLPIPEEVNEVIKKSTQKPISYGGKTMTREEAEAKIAIYEQSKNPKAQQAAKDLRGLIGN